MNIFNFEESKREKLRKFQDLHDIKRLLLCETGSGLGITKYLEKDGCVRGIGTISQNRFHPKFDHLYFSVVDQDSEAILALYKSLINERAIDAPPLQIMYEESEIQEQRWFADEYGFSLALTCDCPEIDVVCSIKEVVNAQLPSELRILRYNQLTSTEKSALREFRLNGYVETHFWSPPIDVGDELWQRTDVSVEGEEVSWCVFKRGKPILCSDAHIEGNDVWLGWGWHDDEFEHDDVLHQAWSKVLSLQLSHCLQFGKRLFGEFDSLDKYGQIKSTLLVHLTKDTKYIFQQKG